MLPRPWAPSAAFWRSKQRDHPPPARRRRAGQRERWRHQSNLLDEKHFGTIGGEVNLQSPDYDDVANRYEIEVTGGANNLTIDEI